MSTQNGKKPLSQKSRPMAFNPSEDAFGNPLGLDPEMVKAIHDKGFAYRFINAKKLQDMGGYHQYGWKPLSLKDEKFRDILDSQTLSFGTDPDGYIRRGDLVLGIRPQAMHEKHQAHERNEALSRAVTNADKSAAEELRRYAKQVGLDTVVQAGFDEDGE